MKQLSLPSSSADATSKMVTPPFNTASIAPSNPSNTATRQASGSGPQWNATHNPDLEGLNHWRSGPQLFLSDPNLSPPSLQHDLLDDLEPWTPQHGKRKKRISLRDSKVHSHFQNEEEGMNDVDEEENNWDGDLDNFYPESQAASPGFNQAASPYLSPT